jgi:hypothetical protein
MRRALLLLLAAASLAACGEDVEDLPVERNTPAVTSPVLGGGAGGVPYENGGADGSGADGSERSAARGGIAAGPDNPDPAEGAGADEATSPPRGSSSE